MKVHVTNDRKAFYAETTRPEGQTVKAAGFRWHPPKCTGHDSWSRDGVCAACTVGVPAGHWWSTDPVCPSKLPPETFSDAVREALRARAAELAEASEGKIVVNYHAEGFWWVKTPKGAHEPFKQAGWLFTGDKNDPRNRGTKPARVGIEWSWWTAQAGAVARFKPNCTPEAVEAIARASDIIAASAALDADGSGIPVPEGLALMPFQRAGVRYLLERPRALLADDMGLGKTVQVIARVNATEDIGTVLIVAPKTLLANWRREVWKWSTRPVTVRVFGESERAAKPWVRPGAKLTYLLANYESMRGLAQARAVGEAFAGWVARLSGEPPARAAGEAPKLFDMVALDEAHNVKNPDGLTGRAIFGDGNKGIGLTDCARYVILATGTPILNRVEELWPLLRAIDPEQWGNREAFEMRYVRPAKYGGEKKNQRLAELQEVLRSRCMIRRRKGDVLKELAPKRYELRVSVPTKEMLREMTGYPVGAEQLPARAELLEQLGQRRAEMLAGATTPAMRRAAWADTIEELEAVTPPFTETTASRVSYGMAKAPWVAEQARALAEERGKVLVFAHHRAVHEALRAALDPDGTQSILITGEVDSDERMEAVDRFQSDDTIRFAFLSIMAAGVGLTLTASSTVIFAEYDWTPGRMEQAEDRAHRIGQSENVLVVYPVIDGTIDAWQAAKLLAKADIAERSLDGMSSLDDVETVELAAKPRDMSVLSLPVADEKTRDEARAGASSERTRKERVEKRVRTLGGLPRELPIISPEQRAAIHAAMCSLSGNDTDFARYRNDVGFARSDVFLGHSLACVAPENYSPEEAYIGQLLVTKYRGQLGDAIVEAAGGVTAK